MNSLAFEVTTQDVVNVLRSNRCSTITTNGKSTETFAVEAFDDLDFYSIERAALFGISLEEQTNYAYDEIARQLLRTFILASTPHASSAGTAFMSSIRDLAANDPKPGRYAALIERLGDEHPEVGGADHERVLGIDLLHGSGFAKNLANLPDGAKELILGLRAVYAGANAGKPKL